jgi:hypothetical protein
MAGIASAASTGPESLFGRIPGVIFSPRATYAGVAARPRALGALAFVLVISVAGTFAFLSTEVGEQAMLDQQVRMIESFGMKIDDAAYERMAQSVGRAKYFGAVGQLITLPLVALGVAGIAFGVFNGAMGGDVTFKQVFAVVSHSGIVISLSQIFGLPLAYARENMSGATNLGVFAPFLDENAFLARVLGSVDLFILWWAVSLAIGLAVLSKKRTGPIATTLIVVYVAIGVIIAAVKSAVSGV